MFIFYVLRFMTFHAGDKEIYNKPRYFFTAFLFCIFLNFFTVFVNAGGHFPQPTPTNNASFFFGSLKINGIDAKTGDEVAFFDPDGVLCGLYAVSQPGKYGKIAVYGDDLTTPSIDEGALNGDAPTVKVWDIKQALNLRAKILSL